jgi:hypothetical protein
MKARFADTERFVAEAAAAAIRQVGRKEARRLFLTALATPPKGKQPDAEENTLLLAAYDRALAGGLPPRRAARVAAEEMAMRGQRVEGLATRIRRLVKHRALRGAEDLEIRRRYAATLLGRFDERSDTDL